MVALYVDRSLPEAADLARSLYAWAEGQARVISTLRQVSSTRLDASPFAGDAEQQRWLAEAGYAKRRTWPQMTRPVEPEASAVASDPTV